MTANGYVQLALYLIALLVLAKPLGAYMARVYESQSTFLDRVPGPVERILYLLARVRPDVEMDWKSYAIAMLAFNMLGLFAVYLLQRVQGWLPLNPQGLGADAVGYDDEAPNAQMTPLRLKVREKVASRFRSHRQKLREWRRYYDARRRASWQYANFALSLSTDFPFRRIRPNRELTYKITAWELRDFPKVLNDFWATAELGRLWEELRPDYAAEMSRYRPARMAEEMEHLWRYLRMPRPDDWIVIHIPNPLQKHFTASAKQFEGYFYSIDGTRSHKAKPDMIQTIGSAVRARSGAPLCAFLAPSSPGGAIPTKTSSAATESL